METYFIRFGLSGSFGGANNFILNDCENDEVANNLAWRLACDEYEEYDGLYGLRTVGEIMEEDEVDLSDAEFTWTEEREDWLAYSAEVYNPMIHDEEIDNLR